MANSQINILHVTGTMKRGGAEIMLMNIFRDISDEFHFSFIINQKRSEKEQRGDFDDEILEKGGNIYHIGTQWELGIFQYCRALKQIIKTEQPAIVHIHLNAKSGVIAMCAKFCGTKNIIVHSHADIRFRGSIWERTINTIEMFFQKILIALFAANYWGCSKEANRRLYWNFLQNKTVIINNAVNLEYFQSIDQDYIEKVRASYGLKKDILILGNVGRLVRHKNVNFIIDIVINLNKNGIETALVFAGRIDDRAYFDEIMYKVKLFNLQDNVLYLGDRNDIPLVLSTFDVFVGTALKEGFGLVAVEAQAAGIPCVLSNGFPNAVDMQLELVTFLQDFNCNLWGEAIIAARNKKIIDKKFIMDQIQSLNFDTKSVARLVGDLYKEVIQ